MGVVGAIRSDSGLGLVGGRGDTGALGLLGAAGSPIRQAQGGFFGDAGMWFDRLTMSGRGWDPEGGRRGVGAAWDVFSRLGECVQFWGRCVQFSGECVQFRGECVHFGGRCVQFSAGRLGWGWGADARRDSSAPLRCARNDSSGGGQPGPGMAGAGNDVNAGNASSACVAGSAGKAGLSGVLRHLCKVRVESRVLA